MDLDDTLWDCHPVITKAEEKLWDWLNTNYPEIIECFDSDSVLKLRKKITSEYPNKKGIIWISAYTIATLTGYYRIAADKHYTSDVIVGAIAGSVVGYLTQKSISKSYFSLKAEQSSPISRGLKLTWRF